MAELNRARLGIPRRDEWIVGGMLLAFFVLRVISLRTSPVVYFDSGDYRHLELWGGRRPFTVPLLFWPVSSDTWRIVEQAAISGIAWITIALVVAAAIEDRRVRLTSTAVFLLLGLTSQITNWDTAILSDSIAISLTVLLVAAWIAVYRAPTRWSVSGLMIATTLWTFTRELHVYITAATALIVAASVIVRRTRAPWRIVAAGLVVIATLGVLESRANLDTSTENLAGVIGARVLPERSVREWFVSEGMPAMPQLAEGQFHADKELLAIPEFRRWAARGWFVYVRYLLTHPEAAINGPYGELLEERQTFAEPPSGRAVLLSPADAYGRARPVLPASIEDALFDPGRTGALLSLAAVAFTGLLIVNARMGGDRRRHVPLIVVCATLPYIWLAWHGSVFEPGRHAMPAAVAVRVGLLALLAVVVDRALSGGDRIAAERSR